MNKSNLPTVPALYQVQVPNEFHPYDFDYLEALQVIKQQAKKIAANASNLLFECEAKAHFQF